MKLLQRFLWLLAGVTAVYALLAFLFRDVKRERPLIIGHRGAAGLAPENTLVAIQAAQEWHVDGIEVDVHGSKDGVVVVIHDTTLDRTTNGSGVVGQTDWAEMQALDAGQYFSPEFAGEPLPTLDQVLALGLYTVIEVKDIELYPNLVETIIQQIETYDAEDRVTIISFDPPAIQTVKELAPHLKVGGITTNNQTPTEWGPSDVVDTFWQIPIIDPTYVWRMHRQGYEVWVWTANEPWAMRYLAWLGVDGLTTNYPDRARAIWQP